MKRQLKKYDVVVVDFGSDIVGSEQGGIRPAIIVQNDTGNKFSDTTLVMPVTKKLKKLKQPTHALLSSKNGCGLVYDSIALGECIRQVSECRIRGIIGSVINENEKLLINDAILANFV